MENINESSIAAIKATIGEAGRSRKEIVPVSGIKELVNAISASNTENKHGTIEDREFVIENFFSKRVQCSLSQELPNNSFSRQEVRENYERYKKNLEGYDVGSKEFAQHKNYPLWQPNKEKTDFRVAGDPNIGWKLHLNVRPEYVQEISQYLCKNGYRHKYLHGGEIEDGKIFTIYVGSFSLCRELAKCLSNDTLPYLCKPLTETEIEFAEGVVGRFSGDFQHIDSVLMRDGPYGFPLLRGTIDVTKLSKLSSQEKIDAAEKAYLYLKKRYGIYFFDEKNVEFE